MAERTLTVLATGPQATVQDLGRPGHAHLGVPRSGAVDLPAHLRANRLVGNPDHAATLEVLAPGAASMRVLHISDLHMLPRQHLKQAWVRELAALEPDLVVNTGDNLAHTRAVPAVVQALGGLLDKPGVFVFGSNDYFGPVAKNPLKYFDKHHTRVAGPPLPWQDLRAAFLERGWVDATHSTHEITAAGNRIAVAGVDDPVSLRSRA